MFLNTVHRRFFVVFHVFLQISVDVVRDQLHDDCRYTHLLVFFPLLSPSASLAVKALRHHGRLGAGLVCLAFFLFSLCLNCFLFSTCFFCRNKSPWHLDKVSTFLAAIANLDAALPPSDIDVLASKRRTTWTSSPVDQP